MLFDCPSPKGTNHAGLYLNSAGYLFDRKGGYWGKSQIKKMAEDALPGSMAAPQLDREQELTVKHEKELRDAFDKIEARLGKQGLDCHPAVLAAVNEVRDEFCGHHYSIRGKPHGADIEEPRAALRHVAGENGHATGPNLNFVKHLRELGLSERDIKHALKIVAGEHPDVEDDESEEGDPFVGKLPASGRAGMGGAMSGVTRSSHEKAWVGGPPTKASGHGAIDAAKEAASRIGFVAGAEPAGRRLSKQERKQIAADAQAASTWPASLEQRFGSEFAANVARIKTTTGRV
jgi:hypothetical protein